MINKMKKKKIESTEGLDKFFREFNELLEYIVKEPYSRDPIILKNPNTEYHEITQKDVEGFKNYLSEVFDLTGDNSIKNFNHLLFLLYKLMNMIRSKNQEISFLNLDIHELKANLEGFSLDHPELYDDRFNIKFRNPYAYEIKQEMENELEITRSKIPKGQAPTKVNKIYKALASVHKTLNERLDRKQMYLACEFLRIEPSRYSNWIAGKDKYGNKNKTKFNNWYKECSTEMMDDLEMALEQFLNNRTLIIGNIEINSLDFKNLLIEHLSKFS
jgi:hypothetical protein